MNNHKSKNDEARLDKGLIRLMGMKPDSSTPEEWAALREEFRLQILFPGQYVAFRDHYEKQGKVERFLHREVLSHSKSLATVQRFIGRLPEEEQRGVFLDYVEAPDEHTLGG
jgi:hypothetical protein